MTDLILERLDGEWRCVWGICGMGGVGVMRVFLYFIFYSGEAAYIFLENCMKA